MFKFFWNPLKCDVLILAYLKFKIRNFLCEFCDALRVLCIPYLGHQQILSQLSLKLGKLSLGLPIQKMHEFINILLLGLTLQKWKIGPITPRVYIEESGK